MSDVRLTCINPEDGSIVPVAGNAKGELKLEEPIVPPEFDGNLDGDLTVTGSAVFGGSVQSGDWNGLSGEGVLVNSKGRVDINQSTSTENLWIGRQSGTITSFIQAQGSATFEGDVVVGSRSKKWMLVESGGLCHMVEQTQVSTADLVDPAVDPGFSVPASADYPKLRDVFAELDVVEKALEQVMEKLRMVEPDGWPVWDGSSNS